MFDFDTWQEIFDSIRQHKLRTALTAFGVGWGIFMLVILLGAGNALNNGVEYEMRDDALNSIWVWPGTVSEPYQGYAINRRIQFTLDDHDMAKNQLPMVEETTARFYLRGEFTIAYKNNTSSFSVRCTHPGHRYIENTIITEGRFLNDVDIEEKRKVAVIGKLVKERLFTDDEEALDKWINVKGVPFKVVGVFEDTGNEREMQMVYLPVTTAHITFNGGKDMINQFMFTIGDANFEQSQAIEKELRSKIAAKHHFSKDDPRAMWVWNTFEEVKEINNLFTGIRVFVWIVGLGSILSGIIGVSNIMMIIVKERTKEIGIRKALGATPWSVVSLILKESILITSLAGYIGLLFGIGLLEIFNYLVTANNVDTNYFRHPEVNIILVLSAMAILVISGALAGLFPAVRAAKVNPVVAMRDE